MYSAIPMKREAAERLLVRLYEKEGVVIARAATHRNGWHAAHRINAMILRIQEALDKVVL